jgi:hypothetical protein
LNETPKKIPKIFQAGNSREALLPAKMLAFDWVNPKWKSVSGGPTFPLRFFSGHLGGPEANVAPTGKGLAICNLLSLPKKKAKLLKNHLVHQSIFLVCLLVRMMSFSTF